MTSLHNQINCNKLRVPFVFSQVFDECELLGFFIDDWKEYARQADEAVFRPSPMEEIECPDYLTFLCTAIRARDANFSIYPQQ